MKISRADLIDQLIEMTNDATERVIKLKSLSSEKLNYKENAEKWSVLECIEHLNLYGDFYLPEIERRILQNKPAPGSTIFYSGIIGNYFANLMNARNGKLKKMSSPKDKNPVNSFLSATSLERFLKQQERLKTLLNQAKSMDLTGVKCSISLTPWIKLRLGDTFRFFIFHIDRHVLQAENILKTSDQAIGHQ